MDFEKIWSRLQAHQGEDFFTVRGICFRYRMEQNGLRPICRNRKTGKLHPTNRVIPESYVRIVWEMGPLNRPSDILRRDPHITGCSYLFSFFTISELRNKAEIHKKRLHFFSICDTIWKTAKSEETA